MDTPTTEAGRALLEYPPPGLSVGQMASLARNIIRIEREAEAAERERLRGPQGAVAHDDDDRAAEARLAEAERLEAAFYCVLPPEHTGLHTGWESGEWSVKEHPSGLLHNRRAAAPAEGLDVEGVIAELVSAEAQIQAAMVVLIRATNTLGGIARLATPKRESGRKEEVMDTPTTDLDALERLLAYSKDLRHIREDREEAEHDLYEALPALIAAARRAERLEAALLALSYAAEDSDAAAPAIDTPLINRDTALDADRLAEAIIAHEPGITHPNRACGRKCVPAIAAEYARLATPEGEQEEEEPVPDPYLMGHPYPDYQEEGDY